MSLCTIGGAAHDEAEAGADRGLLADPLQPQRGHIGLGQACQQEPGKMDHNTDKLLGL